MKILLGVTGGIAAYKSLVLLRLWIQAGHQVQVVMTEGAKAFVQPLSFQALSGQPVRDSLFDSAQEAGMSHIELARWPDVIVIAPCSANTLAKLSQGMADNLLTTLCLATDKPILLAPAMNRLMWHNTATQANIEQLKQRGFAILEPDSGEQACGEVGAGRLPEPETIEKWVETTLAQTKVDSSLTQFWQGKSLLITAGPTLEDLDPVRFIGNRSSGKMGFALAEQAAKAGAEVTLIAGPVHLSTPKGVRRINVRSALDMLEQVQAVYRQVDVFIAAAAVADFRPAKSAEHKLKKQTKQDAMSIFLLKNPDIVAWVAAQVDKPWVVGFAAETESVLPYARQKRLDKQLDLICANQVGEGLGFETEQNQLTLISAQRETELVQSAKSEQALAVLAEIAELHTLANNSNHSFNT